MTEPVSDTSAKHRFLLGEFRPRDVAGDVESDATSFSTVTPQIQH
jgi:hypothetical protein